MHTYLAFDSLMPILTDLEKPKLKARLPNGKTLQDWYSENKVPVCLRQIIPTVF